MGIGLLIVGILTVLFSLTMEVSVSGYSQYGSSDTLNIGLLQNQLMAFQAGLAMAMTGAVLAKLDSNSAKTGMAVPLADSTVEATRIDDDEAQSDDDSGFRDGSAKFDAYIGWVIGGIVILIILFSVFANSKSDKGLDANGVSIEDDAARQADLIDKMANDVEDAK